MAETSPTADLRARVAEYPWFHSIDLGGGVITPGAKTPEIHAAEVPAFFGPIDLDGASVVDIGAWNGFYSFTAKQRGARRVLATDHYCWNHPTFRGRETFELARDALGLEIDMHEIDVPDLSVEALGTFDVVLFLGVFYHLLDPIDGLRRAAALAGDVLVVETYVDARYVDRPAMIFYPGTELAGDATNWWGPNVPLLRALLTTLGFAHIDVQVPAGTRAIVHAWRSDQRRAAGWTTTGAPRRRVRRQLARALRAATQRVAIE